MPAIPASITLLSTLVDRDINTTAAAAVAPPDPLQVVCAWPVSGQYGPGSRYLYVSSFAQHTHRDATWKSLTSRASHIINLAQPTDDTQDIMSWC